MVDASLSIQGAAADAKATGDAIDKVNGRLAQQDIWDGDGVVFESTDVSESFPTTGATYVEISDDKIPVTPNTTYTLFFDGLSVTDDNGNTLQDVSDYGVRIITYAEAAGSLVGRLSYYADKEGTNIQFTTGATINFITVNTLVRTSGHRGYTVSIDEVHIYPGADGNRHLSLKSGIVIEELSDLEEAVTRQQSDIDDLSIVSPNLFDRTQLAENKRFVDDGNTLSTNSTYSVTGYIPIDSVLSFWRATSTGVATCGVFQTAQYDENKTYITDSLNTSTAVQIYSVEAVEGAAYVRIAFTNNRLEGTVGVYEGLNAPLEIADFGIKQIKIPSRYISRDKLTDFVPPPILYTFEDAFVHWQNGEKFPVMFCGDSTTDGPSDTNNDLSNPTDFIDETAYPYVLEQMLKEVTGNQNLRIYNAGYSGKSILNFIDAFDGVMSVYSDAKMAGISFGINDVATEPFYYFNHASTLGFANRLRKLVGMFYDLGIQPFMITSQTMAQVNSGNYREQYRVQQWCNRAKMDVAREYGIPCIDIAALTQLFTMFSSIPSTQIYKDIVHYNVAGHKYEAGVFFREFYPLVETIKSKTIIGPGNRYIKSDLNAVQRIATDANGLKFEWSATNLSESKTILSTYVFIEHEGALPVKAYCSSASSQLITIDGVSTTVTETETDLGTLDVGLHKIVVSSNGQASTNFKGLKVG